VRPLSFEEVLKRNGLGGGERNSEYGSGSRGGVGKNSQGKRKENSEETGTKGRFHTLHNSWFKRGSHNSLEASNKRSQKILEGGFTLF